MATETQPNDKPYREQATLERIHERTAETGIFTVLIYSVIGILIFWSLFPIYWLVTGSFKTRSELLGTPQWIPHDINIQNYRLLFQDFPEFASYIANSVLITLTTTVLATLVGAATAYAFTQYEYPYKLNTILPYYIISMRFLPAVLLAIPFYVVFNNLGLVNTRIGLILVYTAFNVPFTVWMMKGFFEGIPNSLVESAILDGHTELGAFIKVVLPVVKSGLAASAIFTAILTWNELLYAVILTHSQAGMTIPVGLAGFVTKFKVQWIYVTAGGTIAFLPVILIAMLAKDHLVRGFSLGEIEK